MDKARTQSWGLGGVLIVVVALLVGAALPGRSTVSSSDDDPLDVSQLSFETALVAGKVASGGLKIAGLRLQEKTYRLDLQYLAGDDCLNRGEGPLQCPGPHGLNGEVVGRTGTATGDLIVSTRLEVSRACYHGISIGDPWASHPEC